MDPLRKNLHIMVIVISIIKKFQNIYSNKDKKLQIDWDPLGHKKQQTFNYNPQCPYCHSTETLENFINFPSHNDNTHWERFNNILKQINTIMIIINKFKQLLITRKSTHTMKTYFTTTKVQVVSGTMTLQPADPRTTTPHTGCITTQEKGSGVSERESLIYRLLDHPIMKSRLDPRDLHYGVRFPYNPQIPSYSTTISSPNIFTTNTNAMDKDLQEATTEQEEIKVMNMKLGFLSKKWAKIQDTHFHRIHPRTSNDPSWSEKIITGILQWTSSRWTER